MFNAPLLIGESKRQFKGQFCLELHIQRVGNLSRPVLMVAKLVVSLLRSVGVIDEGFGGTGVHRMRDRSALRRALGDGDALKRVRLSGSLD